MSGSTLQGELDRRGFLKAAGAGLSTAALSGCTTNTIPDEGVGIGILAPDPNINPIGASIRNGALLAINDINEEGGILGRQVHGVTGNTKQNPAIARNRYRELLDDVGVDLTTGIFNSEVLLGIMEDMAQRERLHLTTGAGTPEASRQVHNEYEKYKYHFRTGPFNSVHLGRAIVDFADEFFEDTLGWDRVAVLIEDADWAKPAANVVEKELPNVGVDVTGVYSYSVNMRNFNQIYDRLERDDIDGVCALIAHTGYPAVAQWHDQKRPFGFGGIHVPSQAPFLWNELNGSCEYAWTITTATLSSSITPKTQSFTKDYLDRYAGAPIFTAHTTYDALYLMSKYIEESGSMEPDDLIPFIEEEGIDAHGTVWNAGGRRTFYGQDEEFTHDLRYDKESWVSGENPPVFMQWQDGEQVTFAPDGHADGEYLRPDWI